MDEHFPPTAMPLDDPVANGRDAADLDDPILDLPSPDTKRWVVRRKAVVVLTDGLDTEVRNGDRAIVAKASDAEVSTAIKAETNSQVVTVLNQADREGVTLFPLALPSGDPKRLPLPDPRTASQ